MRNIVPPNLEAGRVTTGPYGGDASWGLNGAFFIRTSGALLKIIASDGTDPEAQLWEHVSVSLEHRIPTWEEMCLVKELFWRDDECVVQYHPPKSEYVNCHPYCLHLWRKKGERFPIPPMILVGPK